MKYTDIHVYIYAHMPVCVYIYTHMLVYTDTEIYTRGIMELILLR